MQLCLKHLSHQICFSLPYQPKFAQLLPRPKNAFLQWTSQICTMAGITKFCQYVKILDQNLWQKPQNFSFLFFYHFVKQKAENLCLINGHFMTISYHFFANYIDVFRKTEDHFEVLKMSKSLLDQKLWYLKSVNIWYITLGHWDDGTNESSTKCVMFQVLFFFHDFLQNALQKAFQFILSFVL